MHPFHHHHMGFRRCSGPSRLIWFALGGAATACWFKHNEVKWQNGYYGHCFRPPIQTPAALTEDRSPGISRAINNIPPTDRPWAASAQPEPSTTRGFGARHEPSQQPTQTPVQAELWGRGFGQSQQQWEEEKARLLALGRQAGDTMAEISESTLDNILTAVEALKAKLAEQKAVRDKQRKQLEEQIEREKKEPIRYV